MWRACMRTMSSSLAGCARLATYWAIRRTRGKSQFGYGVWSSHKAGSFWCALYHFPWLFLTQLQPWFVCRVMFPKSAVLEVRPVGCGSAVCLKQSCEWCLASFRCVMMLEAATAELLVNVCLFDCKTSTVHAVDSHVLLMHGGAHMPIMKLA